MSLSKQDRFLQLYEPVHERFERFCRARVYGEMEYSDLMNETLMIAFGKFESLKTTDAFLSFLFGISVRLLANSNRKKKEVPFSEQDVMLAVAGKEQTDRNAEVHLLHKALATLNDAQRECLILFEISGFSIREIAEIQSVSEDAVKQRLKRGRVQLTQLLTFESTYQQGRRHTMETNDRLNELFGSARTQAPKTSYEQTAQAFKIGLATAAGGGVLTKWAATSLKFKIISIMTTISLITLSSALIFSTNSSEKVTKNAENSQKQVVKTEKDADIKHFETMNKTISATETDQKVANSTIAPKDYVKQTSVPALEFRGIDLYPKEFSAFNQQLARRSPVNQIPLATVLTEDSLQMKRFEISEKSTNADIEKIRQQALAAGLEFTFSTKIRQRKIKRLDLHMKKDNHRWTSKISGTDSFSFTFGWWENANGQFERYLCDDDLARICGKCDEEGKD